MNEDIKFNTSLQRCSELFKSDIESSRTSTDTYPHLLHAYVAGCRIAVPYMVTAFAYQLTFYLGTLKEVIQNILCFKDVFFRPSQAIGSSYNPELRTITISHLPPYKKNIKKYTIFDENGEIRRPPNIYGDADVRTQRKRAATERHKPGVVSLLVRWITLLMQ